MEQSVRILFLKMGVESTADISYTATRDAQGPSHNYYSGTVSPFSPRLPPDDLVVYSLSGVYRFVAGPGARSYRNRAASDPVVSAKPGGFFLSWTVPRGVDRNGWR